MRLAHSSARISQTAPTTPLLASQKSAPLASQKLQPLASQKSAPLASQKARQTSAATPTLASQKNAVKVTASKGKGQDSKTIKVNALTFRVRLNDRGFRVMLLPEDRYLVSLRSSEWAAVEHNKAAFVGTVKEKLRERIVKSSGGDRVKLESLLQQIEEASK